MTKTRRRPDTPRRSVPTDRGPSPNGTLPRNDAERDERDALREMFAVLGAERGDDAPKTRTPAPPPTRTLTLTRQPGVTPAQAEARMRLRGLVQNVGLIEDFSGPQFGAVEDLTATVAALEESVAAVQRGELGDAEALLTAQAFTLNAIFTRCAVQAARNLEGQYLEATERYLRLALKAQNQSRATLETLAVLKNPTTIFARQANIAAGPQQVNNTQVNTASAVTTEIGLPSDLPPEGGTMPTPRARAEKSGRNELLDLLV